MVSCGLIEADYGGSLKHSLGPFLIHEGDQNQTAHAQYRYTRNDIIVHTLHTYRLCKGGQLFCLHPAEDVESIDEGRDEEDVGDDECCEDMALTFHIVVDFISPVSPVSPVSHVGHTYMTVVNLGRRGGERRGGEGREERGGRVRRGEKREEERGRGEGRGGERRGERREGEG